MVAQLVDAPLEAALAHAGRGRRVIPLHWPADGGCSCGKPDCPSPGKHPLVQHGKDDATTDTDTIRQWWDRWPQANVGVATGDGLLVLDVDPRHGGEESLRDLERDLGPLPSTVRAVTGGGGLHVYFSASQDFPSRPAVLGPGLDVRCAGGYVVAPPSKHVSGGVYEWEAGHGPDEIDLAPLPDAIAARLKEGGNRRRPAGEVGKKIPEGRRHDTLVSLAGKMRRPGMTADEIAASLLVINANRCDPPLLESEVESIAASVAKYDLADAVEETPKPTGSPPDLGDLLEDVRAFLRRYVIVTDAQADALALWTCHTHAVDAAETTPYLSITSAEKRSGKSLLLEVLSLLAARDWLTGRVTAAVLIRKAARKPALLLDESDAAFKGDKEYAETLRAVLNSGYRRGGVASLCVKKGGDFDLVDFPVFCPKAIAGIGKLPDTVADRSIPIRMKRRAPNEPVARFRWRDAVEEADPIRKGLESWAAASVEGLKEARPDIPPQLDDRAQDGWEPLLAIADAAGGEWPQRGRNAALTLSAGDARDDESLGVRLLQDIRAVFDERRVDRLASADLIADLVAMEEAPWGDLKGKPLGPRGLARMLRRYDIGPRQTRFGEKTLKGYDRGDFDDAWGRYVPIPEIRETSETSETKRQPRLNLGDENVSAVTAVSANTGIQAPLDDADPPGADADDDTILAYLINKKGSQHHVFFALAIELDFPHINWDASDTKAGPGIPGGRERYLFAACHFSEECIQKAIAVLDKMAEEKKAR